MKHVEVMKYERFILGQKTITFGLDIEIDPSLEKNEWLVGQKFEQMKYV